MLRMLTTTINCLQDAGIGGQFAGVHHPTGAHCASRARRGHERGRGNGPFLLVLRMEDDGLTMHAW